MAARRCSSAAASRSARDRPAREASPAARARPPHGGDGRAPADAPAVAWMPSDPLLRRGRPHVRKRQLVLAPTTEAGRRDGPADVDDFGAAVRRVGEGGTALDPEVVAQLLSKRKPLDVLSRRELEVLALLAEGRS